VPRSLGRSRPTRDTQERAIREIGGPEQFRLDELVRKGLAAKGDTREVVADEQARYSGARLSERTLVPAADAQLGEITFDMWLAQQ
jgi:hypothetical protein